MEQTNETKAAIAENASDVSDNQQMAQSISNVENGSNSSNGSDGSQCAQSRCLAAKDGKWFINELDKTTEEIKSKIDLTEVMLQKEADAMTDEISGKLRAAVGKANLLINQKFKQFRELCLKNIVSL